MDVKGLIDTEGEGEFESFLCSCEEKWNEIDRNYHQPNICPFIHTFLSIIRMF